MDEYSARACELFEDKPLTPQKARAQAADQSDVKLHGGIGEQECIALHHHALAELQFPDVDFSGVMPRESNFPGYLSPEIGHHDRLAHKPPFNGAQDLLAERVAAHTSLPENIGRFVNHLPCLCVYLLAGFQVYAGNLKIVTLDAVLKRLRGCSRWTSVGRRNGGSRAGKRLPTVRAETRIGREFSSAVCTESHDSNMVNELSRPRGHSK